MKVEDITLVKTCSAHPEQYGAVNRKGETIGYLRLRWGYFSVECPHVDGVLVYDAAPKGDGMFESDERDHYLQEAKEAICKYYNEQ